MKKTLSKEEILRALQQELPRLRAQFGVRRIALYGSFSKSKAYLDSDIDLLVELERPLGLRFIRLASDLQEFLGRPVDLNTFDSLQRAKLQPRRAHIAADIEKYLAYVE